MKKTLSILAIGAFLPLCAQDSLRYGVQASTTTPVGVYHGAAAQGFGLGAFAKYDVGQGHGLIAKFDAKQHITKHYDDKSARHQYGLGVDYTYHIDQQQDGVYALAGLGVVRDSERTYAEDKKAESNSMHYLRTTASVGAGYDLNSNLGMQVRYDAFRGHNCDGNSKTVFGLNLGVTYTF